MKIISWRFALLGAIATLGAAAQGQASVETSTQGEPVFATVNGEPILRRSYENALRVAGRQRFYHGKAPEPELVAFRKEVAERLITDRVLLQEARRRGLQPDQAWVDAEFEKIERRYSVSPQWHESGESLQREIRRGLEERNLIERADKAYKQVVEPDEKAVRAYYARYPEKFTSPEQIKVTTILLKVDPSSPRQVWDARRVEAETILAEVTRGGDFTAYSAKYPPSDQSQLGYIHRGMLGRGVQDEIDKLNEGEISGVVQTLEGFGIFRLEGRIEARLNAFDKVKERASALLSREATEQNYQNKMKALRESARVEFSDPDYALGPRGTAASTGLPQSPVGAQNQRGP